MRKQLKGKVVEVRDDYIIFESHNRGAIYYVVNSSNFSINEEITLFIYHFKANQTNALFGFKTNEELNVFEDIVETLIKLQYNELEIAYGLKHIKNNKLSSRNWLESIVVAIHNAKVI